MFAYVWVHMGWHMGVDRVRLMVGNILNSSSSSFTEAESLSRQLSLEIPCLQDWNYRWAITLTQHLCGP